MNSSGARDPEALILGRALAAPDSASAGGGPVTFAGDSHLLTIAPSGPGRGRGCLIPNLLTYTGQVVVTDVDGSAYAATAEARRTMGHTVVRLDPFGVIGPESDALNPLDLLDGLTEPALSSVCLDLASLGPLRHPYADAVDDEAFGLLSGLIDYVAAVARTPTFTEIQRMLQAQDVIYDLAVVLDTAGKNLSMSSYSEISSFLSKDVRQRNRIVARLLSYFTALGAPEVHKSLGPSTVALAAFRSRAPVTVYLVIPADRLVPQAALLRLWLGTLLLSLSKPGRSAALPTLFLLDHCAELGTFPLLNSLLRFGSAQQSRMWTFWHDVHQLRTAHPGDWQAIVSGCGAVQIFGTGDSAAAAEAAALFGLAAHDVWSLAPGEQVVVLDGKPHRTLIHEP